MMLLLSVVPATAYTAEVNQLRIYISNQSFAKPQENITLNVNGEVLYNRILPVKEQHHYEEFTVQRTNDMKQWISVMANDTKAAATLSIDTKDINDDTWISVEYWYSEDRKIGYFSFVTGRGLFLID